ncbi:MAG: hypothetical protein HXY30_10955 [Pseudorhodoplanes sp.]|nr:hypothetical protein [Pseudorhodoplanes sp.]
MRFLLTIAFAVCAATAAQAEKRVFIIASGSDGYGIDRCLASGDACGAAAASAYCRSRDFAQAASYRKVVREEMTGGLPARTDNCGRSCDEFVAIECTR